jgi:hypothetical protein
MPVRRAILGLAVLPLLGAAVPALAQGKLEASYSISVARIPIGGATSSIDITDAAYTVALTGKAGGMLRVVSSGDGTMSASGTVTDGRLAPSHYTSRTTADDDTLDVTMVFAGGNVTALTASPPPPDPNRIELTDEHRQQVLDPLTAMLVPAAEGGVTEAACQRTLPVFDGRRRYNLKLAFKRIEQVKADKGYAGPVAVCAVTFQPIAGHRGTSPLVKFLSEGRDVEMALAPIAGTHVLAPFRVTVVHMLGNIVVRADRFESVPTTTGQSN